MKRLLINLTFFIILFFSIIGFIQVDTIFHELGHQSDFKETNATKESICLLSLATNGSITSRLFSLKGYYGFTSSKDKQSEYERINEYTEIKQYTFSTVRATIFSIIIFFMGLIWLKKDWLIKFYETELNVTK